LAEVGIRELGPLVAGIADLARVGHFSPPFWKGQMIKSEEAL
jgi:hypothetical protein